MRLASFYVLSILLISPSLAIAAPFTVDMTAPLHEEDGAISKHTEQATKDDPKCEKCQPITVGFAISHALNQAFPDEQSLPGEQKWARSVLADRIRDNKAAALTASEVALIVKLVEKAYPGVYIKQIIPLIDPNHPAPKIAE